MFIETVKTPGIAHLSYVVGCDGHACVIDPQLDYLQYIKIATNHNCHITHIFETHRNEDFISGALSLAQQTNAKVFHGENADQAIAYAHVICDGDTFNLGSAELKILATPGHTKDSICITLADTHYSPDPIAVFTGDTLFVADVGRTDFYPDEKETMAAKLYDSLQKLLSLGDDVQVFPAHGAGSVCGGGIAEREFTTIGYERKHNTRLKLPNKQAFINAKINETHYYAPYFKIMEQYNSSGLQKGLNRNECQPLTEQERKTWLDSETRPGVVIDVRSVSCFRESHLRHSISLPGGLLSAYGGWLLPYKTPLLLVTSDSEQAESAHMQLSRMGYFDCVGYITSLPVRTASDDPVIDSISTVTAEVVESRLSGTDDDWVLLDVRKADEVNHQPLPGAVHSYLGYLVQSIDEYNPDVKYTCMCGSDKRATVAASILKRFGIKQVEVFEGSLKAWLDYHA